jgi:hypothetical protein
MQSDSPPLKVPGKLEAARFARFGLGGSEAHPVVPGCGERHDSRPCVAEWNRRWRKRNREAINAARRIEPYPPSDVRDVR